MGRRPNMCGAIQTQKDEIGLESVRGKQDLFTRYSELNQQFWFGCRWSMRQNQFLELFLASNSSFFSHLHKIACS